MKINKKILVGLFFALVLFSFLVFFFNRKVSAPKNNEQTSINTDVKKDTKQESTNNKSPVNTFNKNQYSIDNPTSIWIIVNKKRPLSPQNYVPTDLMSAPIALSGSYGSENMKTRSATSSDLKAMVSGAKANGINLVLVSGYRSYNTQVSVYGGYVKSSGVTNADKISARPGHSEHQTGLALDLGRTDGKCSLEQCFGSTPEGIWLKNNSYLYGFIVRYPAGKESIVGYEYEPWHMRYVGKDLAKQIHSTNLTLEEFFGLPAAPTY